MPRKGKAYQVDVAWRQRVESRLLELGITKAEFARRVGCPQSLVTELLAGKRKQTTYLPEMHAELAWPPPLGPLPSKDAGELAYLWDRLDEAGRERLIAKGREELDRILKRDVGKKK